MVSRERRLALITAGAVLALLWLAGLALLLFALPLWVDHKIAATVLTAMGLWFIHSGYSSWRKHTT